MTPITLPPPDTHPPPPPGWEGILDPDEAILWQGAPVRGIDWSKLIDLQTVFGLFFTGFAIFWINMASGIASRARDAPPFVHLFPLFGLIFVGVGLNMVIGRHIWAAYRRHGTLYTLTSKAAYIATQPLGKRSLKRYGFDEMSGLSLTDTSPGSVHFAERSVTHTHEDESPITFGSDGLRTGRRSTTVRTPVGFERIDDARTVYRLLRDARGER